MKIDVKTWYNFTRLALQKNYEGLKSRMNSGSASGMLKFLCLKNFD